MWVPMLATMIDGDWAGDGLLAAAHSVIAQVVNGGDCDRCSAPMWIACSMR